MRRIRSKDTGPEMAVRRLLHSAGYRYRLHDARLPGKPDLVFPSRKAVVLIHGCYWHGHGCKRGARVPKTNSDYWQTKIARNKARDVAQAAQLHRLGWRTFEVWECDSRSETLLARLTDFLGPRQSPN